jgi:hypothetical protein
MLRGNPHSHACQSGNLEIAAADFVTLGMKVNSETFFSLSQRQLW